MNIPKLSAPLIKDIRTGEGIFEWLTALLLVVAGATSNLSWAHTATYLTIVAGIKGARRGLVKIVSLQNGAGIGAPIQPQVLSTASEVIGDAAQVGEAVVPSPTVDKVLSEISAAEASAAQAQVEPGTPAEQVTSGLHPEPPQGLGTVTQGAPQNTGA